MSSAAPRSPGGGVGDPAGASGESGRGGETRVLFVAPSRRLTFVEQDLATLGESCRVDVLLREELPARRQRLWAVFRRLATRRYHLLFIWFAEPYDTPYLLLLARLLGVPSAVVVGGYELAALPDLGYGALASRGGRLQVRLALRLADALLPTSELLAAEARDLGRRDGRGLEMIPPGIDCDFFRPEPPPPAGPRERLVVTVATLGEPAWRVKGLDVFAACSRLLPDVRFVILGPGAGPGAGAEVAAEVSARLRELGGDNLSIDGRRLAPAELRAWYRRAAVYAQLSARESFGIATAEAMACGCVPVATAVGGLPQVVGDTGILVPPGEPRAAARAIAQALAQAADRGPALAARRRIESSFGAPRRRAALAGVVARLTGGAAERRSSEPAVPRRVPAAGGGR